MLEQYAPSCCKPDKTLVNGETNRAKRKKRASSHDTGWAWVIVVASFILQFLIDGTISGFGIIFLAMQQDEAFLQANYTRTMLAVPGSIQPGFFLCTGAFASPLIQRLGFRVMGSIGSGLVGSGLGLASMQKNLHLFNLFYGVFAGSGFGILMVCAIVSVNFYFERFRGIASGISMAGAGVGCLTIPLVFSRLCLQLGWRRALMIYSVVAFVMALCATITFRPFVLDDSEEDLHESNVPDSLTVSLKAGLDQDQCANHELSVPVNANVRAQTEQPNHAGPTTLSNGLLEPSMGLQNDTPVNAETTKMKKNNDDRRYDNAVNEAASGFPSTYKKTSDEPLADDFGSTVGSRLWKSTLAFKRNHAKPHNLHQSTVTRVLGIGSGDIHLLRSGQRDSSHPSKKASVADPFQRIDIFFSASFSHLGPRDAFLLPQDVIERLHARDAEHMDGSVPSSLHRSGQLTSHSGTASNGFLASSNHISSVTTLQPNYTTSMSLMKPEDERLNSSGSLDTGQKMFCAETRFGPEPHESLANRFRNRLITLFDLSLFTHVRFAFILMIGVANQLAYFIPFVYLVDYAVSKGLSQNQAVSLSVILGSLHTIGRIMAGFFANVAWMDTVYLSGFGTLAAALTHLALPSFFPVSFDAFAAYATMHGLFSAFPVPMIHLLLVRFLGLERLTASYGNLNLVKSVASVVGPMVAVSLVDHTGETGHYFVVAGICLLLSALAHLGLCRFPCSESRDNEDAVDERAKCCLFGRRRSILEQTGEETVAYVTETNGVVEQTV